MKINADHTVSLELEPCHWCANNNLPKGMMPGRKTCPDCHGTRRGKRGGKDKCQTCFSFGDDRGKVADRDHPVTCSACGGTATEKETIYSHVTDAFLAEMYRIVPIRFVLQNRGITFNEAWLGLGCLYGCGDYGAAWKGMETDRAATESKIVAEIHKNRGQLLNYAREDKNSGRIDLCKAVYVLVHRGGYSARPSYTEDGSDVMKVAAHEPSESKGLAIGIAVADAGGHGTLAAATGIIH